MAGTVRKRTWTTRKGEVKTAWIADYFDQHRKRHKRQFTTRRMADVWLTRAKLEVESGIHTPDATSITVAEAAELWLNRRETVFLEHGTLYAYQSRVAHVLPQLGAIKLARLTAPMVEDFADMLVKQVSWRRASDVLATLRMILAHAHRRGLAAQNVAASVKMSDNERTQRPLAVGIDVPTIAEVRALSEAAVSASNRALFLAAAFTGARASELRGLKWSHVDFDKRLVTIRQRADRWGTLGPTKSKNGYRDIPLMPLVANALRAWRLASSHGADGDLVFPSQNGAAITHSTIWRAFGTLQQAAGVVTDTGAPKYHLHVLRHFFASWGIAQGFSPKRLQALLGHGSIKMTYDVYGHWLGDLEDDHARFAAGEVAVFGTPKLIAP